MKNNENVDSKQEKNEIIERKREWNSFLQSIKFKDFG